MHLIVRNIRKKNSIFRTEVTITGRILQQMQ